jgi:cardiolipin synthase
MEEAGVQIRHFWPHGEPSIARVNFRLHKKILIGDGRSAIIGGMNFGSHYFEADRWRDTNVLLTGPVVKDIQDEFIADWIDQNGWPDGTPDLTRYYPQLEPTGPGNVRNVDQEPYFEDFDINRLFELLIQQASSQVLIQTPYFIPNDHVQRLFRDAVARGVEVIILTNGRTSNDLGQMLFLPSSLTFKPLHDAGVQIYLWEAGFEYSMHAKAMLIDDVLGVLGSYNLSSRSYQWDTENVVVLTEPSQVAQVREMLDDDLSQPWIVRVDDDWFGTLSIWDRILAWFYNLFSWLM